MCGLKNLLAFYPSDSANAAVIRGLIPSRISCVCFNPTLTTASAKLLLKETLSRSESFPYAQQRRQNSLV